jgi:hypothetical protein
LLGVVSNVTRARAADRAAKPARVRRNWLARWVRADPGKHGEGATDGARSTRHRPAACEQMCGADYVSDYVWTSPSPPGQRKALWRFVLWRPRPAHTERADTNRGMGRSGNQSPGTVVGPGQQLDLLTSGVSP